MSVGNSTSSLSWYDPLVVRLSRKYSVTTEMADDIDGSWRVTRDCEPSSYRYLDFLPSLVHEVRFSPNEDETPDEGDAFGKWLPNRLNPIAFVSASLMDPQQAVEILRLPSNTNEDVFAQIKNAGFVESETSEKGQQYTRGDVELFVDEGRH